MPEEDLAVPPLVTILIANYNGGAFLERAIRSAFGQTLPRQSYELVVADDGSADGSQAVIQRYGSELVHLALPHRGLPATCNDGILTACGRYLIRLDADDELEPAILEEAAAVLDSCGDVAMVTTDRWEIDDAQHVPRLVLIDPENLFTYIAPGVMFRREALLEVGGYDELYWEEYDLFIRILEKYKRGHVPSPLYRYHRHASSMTANLEARRRGWEVLIRKWGIDRLRRFGHWPELEEVYATVAR